MNTQRNDARTWPASRKTLAGWLLAEGFRDEGTHGTYGAAWYRKGPVRVVIEDEASICLYVFDTRYPKSDVLAWDARFNSAPMGTVTATIRNAGR
jgi:hypothetical protein